MDKIAEIISIVKLVRAMQGTEISNVVLRNQAKQNAQCLEVLYRVLTINGIDEFIFESAKLCLRHLMQ